MKHSTLTHEIGVGLRPKHYKEFYEKRPELVSWVEVISENFMDWSDRSMSGALENLLKIRKHTEVSLHGVSMSIGSSDELNLSYLESLKRLIHTVEPESVSDHLCWTRHEGISTHDLLPMPYNEEALSHIVGRIHKVQDYLGREMAFENLSSYVEFRESQMEEWEFVREVVKRSGCKLILDLNNVYVSSVNHGFRAMDYLSALDLNRIEHIHLAGHSSKDGFLIDTHDAPVAAEVWELYEWATKNIPKSKVMIERDDNIPEWNEIESELRKILLIQEKTYVERSSV